MLPSWAGDTILRIRAGRITRRGSVEMDWSNTIDAEIAGCSMQPIFAGNTDTTLSQENRTLGITDVYTCFLPPQADVMAGDKIVYEGKEFQIIGEPRKWSSPTGRVSHIQVQLQRWSG